MREDEVVAAVEDMIDSEMRKSSADLDKIVDLRNALVLFSGVGTFCTVDGLWEIVARSGLYDMARCLLEKGCREGFGYSTDYDAVMEGLRNLYRDYELTCDPEGEEHIIDEGDLLSCAVEGKSEQIIRFLVPRCEDVAHWWPRDFPSSLGNAETREWIYALGIDAFSDRVRKLYGD